MELILIRHAIAEERDDFQKQGKSDFYRPLTASGKKKFSQAAKGIRHLVPKIDRLISSPLIRAIETAEILQGVYSDLEIEKVEALAPDQEPVELLGWLEGQDFKQKTILCVGHEPQLSRFLSYSVSFAETAFLHLEKGSGACLTHDEGSSLYECRFQLSWIMNAKQVRTFGQLNLDGD